jgi:hypothetical protein
MTWTIAPFFAFNYKQHADNDDLEPSDNFAERLNPM